MHVPGDENYLAQGFWNHNTGLGKSFDELEWARIVVEKTNKPVLIMEPLAVGPQLQREAERFGIDARYIREPEEIDGARAYITNYERQPKFDPSLFGGVVAGESGILKNFTGKTTRRLIADFAATPYRLAATATPAPNDHVELGTHAEFLGIMRRDEMLARWFINDAGDTGTWRLKGHAAKDFWRWVASWARCVTKPSDLGYPDDGFVLPRLHVERQVVGVDRSIDPGADKHGQAFLFRSPEMAATSIHKEKRLTAADRADRIAELTYSTPGEYRVIWVDTDYEADAVMARVPEAIEVRGSMHPDMKEDRLDSFSRGQFKLLVTKAKIAGWGLNWQHCNRTTICANYSYEAYYQIVRRFWRFGQVRPVFADVVMADTEAPIWSAVMRKAEAHETMKAEMAAAMREAVNPQVRKVTYQPTRRLALPSWLGDAS